MIDYGDGMTVRNVGREVGDLLEEEYGFERSEVPGRYFRIEDAQHALVYKDGHWHVRRDSWKGGGDSTVSAQLWVARLDINELSKGTFQRKDRGGWWPTVNVTREIRPWGFGSYTGRFEGFDRTREMDVAEWVETWLPEWAEKTPNMPLLTEVIAKQAASPNNGVQATVRSVRWMTAMLDGWTDADEEEFHLSYEREHPPEPDKPDTFLEHIGRARAWIAEHPDGIERELMD